ncbi:ParA family protein [Yersinia pseudotuberculosis]|uniref:ParA family protein n=1 Tax=Yersinia pseudotuberculosis TaxID=633 RepID=UPI001A9CF7F7|nr:ParA family protein [Yersinia pseudotuberculosis]MBO1550688.1 AAA family ATPase [Yersinia pseudotuberculosis]MBO1572203.1 AAA family ATPase [Yersinia pseudotuberculosis]MBO1587095.1 AAA family ATPase [Yersinia pseudotuberculosis]MBO1636598.1 AAA family ATPase [Yersinia pseudotuberculosis]
MAKVVSLINMKGGVGKSTLSVNLAWHLAAYSNWKKKVLVVDLDPQFNASQYLVGVNKYNEMLEDGKPTIWDIFEQHTKTPTNKVGKKIKATEVIRNIVKYRGGGQIDLIPSRLELSLSLKSSSQRPHLLNKLLNEVKDDYDIVLIDCAPTESMLTTAAYIASDYILVPVKPEYLSTIGLPLLKSSVESFLDEYSENELEVLGIIFNGTEEYIPEENKSKNEVKAMAVKNNWTIFDSEIPYSRSYPKGAREGKPIFGTSYARTVQCDNFREFANEFGHRAGL